MEIAAIADRCREPVGAVDHENRPFFTGNRDGRLAARVCDRNRAACKPVPSRDHIDRDPA